MLLAGGADTVVGGLGDDVVGLNVLGQTDPSTIEDEEQFAREAWDERATGIETFHVIGMKMAPTTRVQWPRPGAVPVVPVTPE